MDHNSSSLSHADHSAPAAMKMFNCDGTVAVHNGGDLRGHVAPGAMFILWATHWMLASFLQHVRNPRRYRAQPTYPLLHYDYVPVEQLFKFVLPLVGLTGEIWWANGYARQLCPPGTARAGHFSMRFAVWQHAMMYCGFLVSGFVDLLAYASQRRQRRAAAAATTAGGTSSLPSSTCSSGAGGFVPANAQFGFLALAFLSEALLMGLHEKHEPFDKTIHWLLTITMPYLACIVALEAAMPTCFMLTCAKIHALLLQGIWFITIAHMLFTGRPAWSVADGDSLPAMYAVLLFCFQVVFIALGMLLFYMLLWFLTGGPLEPEAELGAASSSKQPRLLRSAKGILRSIRRTLNTTLRGGAGLAGSRNARPRGGEDSCWSSASDHADSGAHVLELGALDDAMEDGGDGGAERRSLLPPKLPGSSGMALNGHAGVPVSEVPTKRL